MIKITDITPFMRKGWVAMDKDKRWWWHSKKPHKICDEWDNNGNTCRLGAFDIAPADDWTKSLIKVGGK